MLEYTFNRLSLQNTTVPVLMSYSCISLASFEELISFFKLQYIAMYEDSVRLIHWH
jgi:hypothetical protein